RVLERFTGRPSTLLRPSKGVHLVVPREAIAARPGIFMRTEKSIFHALPWGDGHWLLGDTDTAWDGSPDEVVASGADRDYVLAKVNGVLRTPVEASDVVGVFAGLRPLVASGSGADTARLSRGHRLFQPLPGVTAIAGGKYTTYRVMARDAVDAAVRDLGGGAPSRTADVPLVGARAAAAVPSGGADVAPLVGRELGWSEAETARRVAAYVRLRDAEAAALEEQSDGAARARYAAVLRGDGQSPERS